SASSAARGGRRRRRRRYPLGPSVHPLPRLAQHLPENADDLVELLLAGDERWRDLHHRVAAVVGAADQAALEEPGGEGAAEQRLRLVVAEGLARLLVLHELERVQVPGTANVPDDRQVEQLLERGAQHRLVLANVLDDPVALHDL